VRPSALFDFDLLDDVGDQLEGEGVDEPADEQAGQDGHITPEK